MSLAMCQINPIDVNFHLQKSLEIFDKNSAEQNLIQKDKEMKVSPLMPIRVKTFEVLTKWVLSYVLLWWGAIASKPFNLYKNRNVPL